MDGRTWMKGCLFLTIVITTHCGNGDRQPAPPPSPQNPAFNPSAASSLCACLQRLDMQGAGTGFTTTPSDGLSMPMAATDDPPPEWTNVDRAVLAQVATIGARHVLLVGDSLTYNNPTGSICGWPAVKAGYVNATWQEVRDRPLWGQFASRAAIVLLGTNNALRGTAVTEQEMQQLLGRLAVEQRIVATPPPLQPPAATPPMVQALTEVQTLVLALPYPAIDTRNLSDASFFAPDGIHLTAQGYATLNPLMEQSPVCQ